MSASASRVVIGMDPHKRTVTIEVMAADEAIFGTVWGHVGQVPGYSSENFTDRTGRRTVSIFTATIFGLAEPKTGTADQALVNAAGCTMLGKPVPATPPATG